VSMLAWDHTRTKPRLTTASRGWWSV